MSLKKKLLISYLVFMLLISITLISHAFEVKEVDNGKRSVALEVSSNKNMVAIYMYKKSAKGTYILFYKAKVNANTYVCVIPENKLSTQSATDFKVVVEYEENREIEDIHVEALPPYPSINPEETAKPSWSPPVIPTKPTPTTTSTTSPSASETPSEEPTSSTEPSLEPSSDPSEEPSPTTSLDPGTKLNAKEVGQIIANCARDCAENRKDEFAYGSPKYSEPQEGRKKAYQGIKVDGYLYGVSTGKYPGKQNVHFNNRFLVDCAGFCNCAVHWSTGLGAETYTTFMSSGEGFKAYSKSSLNMGKTISKSEAAEKFLPGDIIHWSGHYAIYVGDGKIAECVNYGKPSLSSWTLHLRDVNVWNGHHDFKEIFRVTEETAAQVDITKVDSKYLNGIRSDNTVEGIVNIPYINQQKGSYNASQKKYENTDWPSETLGTNTVSSFGCLLCSSQMVLSYLEGSLIDLNEGAKSMYSTGGGAAHWDFRKSVSAFGYKYRLIIGKEEVDQALKEGKPVIAHIKGDLGTKDYSELQHFIVIVKQLEDGKYAVSDPDSEENTYLLHGKTFDWNEINNIAIEKDYSGAGYPDMKYIIIEK